MKNRKEITKAITKIKNSLRWPVVDSTQRQANFQIDSIPGQGHVIYWPLSGELPRLSEYLHELCHAYLAEYYHHQFSGQYFQRRTPAEVIEALKPVCRAAGDWFADGLLYKYAPRTLLDEVREHLQYCLRLERVDPEWQYGVAMIVAQAKFYCKLRPKILPELRDLVEVYLETDPFHPDVHLLAGLINRLAAGRLPFQVELVHDGQLEVWLVKSS